MLQQMLYVVSVSWAGTDEGGPLGRSGPCVHAGSEAGAAAGAEDKAVSMGVAVEAEHETVSMGGQ
jgi:hypothetical protein